MSTDNGDTSAERTPDSPLHVSAVDISLASDSHKTIHSVELYQKDTQLRKVEKSIRPGESHQEKFNVTLDIRDRIRALVRCSSRWGMRIDVDIEVDLHESECKRNEGDPRCFYRNQARKIEVVVSAQQTQQTEPSMPTLMSEIIKTCPRFRLLVMGNSGVGKSTLIHNIFGVAGVKPSRNIRGKADIEQEFISERNDRIVVHDSLGFEAGDEGHMKIVKEFVAKRMGMAQIRDQLHAIWLCLEIPYAGGRLLETGVEELLKRRKEILRDIPLVVVLTKVDLLDGQLETELPEGETLEHYRSQYMEEHCIKPLRDAAGPDVTHTAVSSSGEDYAESLRELLKATMDKMTDYDSHDDEGPSTVVVVAQRISIKEKIDLSIRMGKKKYWKTLRESAVFRGRTMKECLEVIHKDIITIWNFNDPYQYLIKDEFTKILYTNIVAELKQPPTTSSTDSPGFFSRQLEGVLGSEDTMFLVPHALTRMMIAVPNRVYRVYSEARDDAKILIAYIVDLICVMQVIFLLVPGDGVKLETIALALKAYEGPRKLVHQSVATMDENVGVGPGATDYAMEKIEDLLWRLKIEDDQINELRHKIPRVVLQDFAAGS